MSATYGFITAIQALSKSWVSAQKDKNSQYRLQTESIFKLITDLAELRRNTEQIKHDQDIMDIENKDSIRTIEKLDVHVRTFQQNFFDFIINKKLNND